MKIHVQVEAGRADAMATEQHGRVGPLGTPPFGASTGICFKSK